jgi:copper chaperone CopZ
MLPTGKLPGDPSTIRTVSGIKFTSATADAERECPVCGETGRKVTPTTVVSHVREVFWASVGTGFWFCWTKECPIFYYDNERGLYFSKDPAEVRSRFGLKETGSPRPICYCLGINLERILDEVVVRKCCTSLEDVEHFTRVGTGKWCLITNPSGVCCRSYLREVVGSALELAGPETKKSLDKVAIAVESPEEPLVVEELSVGGMDCESCTLSVAAALEQAGGQNVTVDFGKGVAHFSRPGKAPLEGFLQAVSEAGYAAWPRGTNPAPTTS